MRKGEGAISDSILSEGRKKTNTQFVRWMAVASNNSNGQFQGKGPQSVMRKRGKKTAVLCCFKKEKASFVASGGVTKKSGVSARNCGDEGEKGKYMNLNGHAGRNTSGSEKWETMKGGGIYRTWDFQQNGGKRGATLLWARHTAGGGRDSAFGMTDRKHLRNVRGGETSQNER